MTPLAVIKIGASALDEENALSEFLRDFAAITCAKVLIHGGGKIATKIGDKLGVESRYVDGRRITDAPTRDLVTMVYGGLLNKKITAQLQGYGCDALGLCGADGALIAANKRPVKDIDYGYVGDVTPQAVNVALLSTLIDSGYVPVIAPLTYADGEILNTNADSVAGVVAKALSRTYSATLAFCSEKRGVLGDMNDPDSVIAKITPDNFPQLKATGAVSAGMLPKLENAFEAVRYGVNNVWIGDAAGLPLFFKNQSGGTVISTS